MNLLTYNYGYVYKTTNLINQKIYIGQHKHHEFDPSYKGSGTRLWIAINKYGIENFNVELIKWCSSSEELDKYEVFYIRYFNSINQSIGYNLTTAIYQRGKTSKGKFGNHNHLGKKLTDEQRYNLSISHKGQNAHNIGKCVYNDGVKNYYFNENDTIPEGFIRGKLPLNYKRKSPSNLSHGRICINDGKKNYRVYPDELQGYLDKGFERGLLNQPRGRIHIHKDGKRLLIDPDELNKYIKLGYELGQGFSSNKGRILLKKDGHRKYIYEHELDNYKGKGYTDKNNNLI